MGGVDFLQNKLDCFVHEQFRVEAKAEVIKRFYFFKGMSRGEGESGEEVEEVWGSIGAYFLYYCFFDWCLLFVLIRHGEEGATSLHAGLERLGKETGEPTGPLGPTP